MSDPLNSSDARLLATLNDLLQLDHDAVQAYTVAMESLQSEPFRSTVRTFRGDHERHISELTRLVQERGGTPMELPHIPTGMFKLALQKAAAAGSDRELLLAFKANEGQVRDKYRRAAADALPVEVSGLVRRNAADEERHYAWVTQAVEALGAGAGTALGRTEAVVETVHGRTADAIEAGEREVMVAAEGAHEQISEMADRARDTAAAVGERARELASNAGDRARELASNAGDRALGAAGSGLTGAARGLDRAADWADDRGGVTARAATPVRRVADVLEQEGIHLQQQDLDAVRHDVETGVRTHPIRSVLIAAGIG
ncbi:MAG TPA: ferritin-like domain-containing protein, partial [Longimicrobiales bacterium]